MAEHFFLRLPLPLKFLKLDECCPLTFRKTGISSNRGGSQRPAMAMHVSNSPPAVTPLCRKHQTGMSHLASHDYIGWLRTPIRRKQYKRRPHKPNPTNPHLRHAFHLIFIASAVVHFYTTHCRAYPHIVFMETLLVFQSSQLLLSLAAQVLISFHFLSTSINKIMHTLNGNIPHMKEPSILISLSDRLPPFPQEQNPHLPHTSSQPIRLFDLLYPNPSTEHPDPTDDPIPIHLLLRYRPPKTTPSLAAPPILPTTARRPLHQRSGRRRTVRVNHRVTITFKAPGVCALRLSSKRHPARRLAAVLAMLLLMFIPNFATSLFRLSLEE